MSDELLDEISKLNNELVSAQRSLALQNRRLQSALNDLEDSKAQIAVQRDDIQRVNQELLRSNEDLQQFAYVVSHDIQAPLRAIHGFAELLQTRYAGKLEPKADQWIHYIINGVEQMSRLVNDMLAHARTDAQHTSQPVDLNSVVDCLKTRFAGDLAAACGKLTIGQLPVVVGDPTQLELLLQNLVQNAIHYRSDAAPEIHIDSHPDGDDFTISVRDNGLGIAPENHTIIFEPLRRLSPGHDDGGTGLGLAICNKIVKRHGGKLWLESQLGAGSTFFFTLPAARNAST